MISREMSLSEQPAANLYGLTMLSDDRTQAKDVRDLYQCYKTAVHAEEGAVVPALYRYQRLQYPQQRFHAVYRGNIQAPGLRPIMPGGLYAHFPVRARFGYSGALRSVRRGAIFTASGSRTATTSREISIMNFIRRRRCWISGG